jgi:hypothetical protein
MSNKPQIGRVVEYLKALLPDIDAVVHQMEKDGGWLRLSPKAIDFFNRLKISNYAENYVDEKRLWALFAVAMAGEGPEVREFLKNVEQAYREDPDQFMAEATAEIEGVDAEIDAVLAMSDADKEEVKAEFEGLPEAERLAKARQTQFAVSFMVLAFFQTLALMVHGRKMTALVAGAIGGDDDAFCKAVQVDRSVLVSIPYFRERLLRSHLEGDGQFCERLGYRMANPVLKGKIRYRTLWIVFSFLELFGMLDSLKHREILDICDKVGVGGKKGRIEEVGYLSKRLAEYRRFQKKGGRVTH